MLAALLCQGVPAVVVPPPVETIQLLIFAQPSLEPQWAKDRRRRKREDDEDVLLMD